MAGKVELLNRIIEKRKDENPLYTYKNLNLFLQDFAEELAELLNEDEVVTIIGLGRFKKSARKFEMVGNRKNWKLTEEGKKKLAKGGLRPYVTFRASKLLKGMLNVDGEKSGSTG